jgi:hypothetical protein
MRKMYEMKTVVSLCVASTLLAAAFGCSESSTAAADTKATPAPVKTVVARTVLPSGTVLRLSLTDTLDTKQNSAGDHFAGSLAEAVVVNGKTLLPEGTLLHGRVIDAKGAGKVKGRASISLELTELVRGNKAIAIATDTYAAEAKSTQKRDAGVIAGGAGVGAVIGAIAGGKKGAGIGAVTGGGAGTGVVLATKGNEIHYGPETRLNFTLSNSVNLN